MVIPLTTILLTLPRVLITLHTRTQSRPLAGLGSLISPFITKIPGLLLGVAYHCSRTSKCPESAVTQGDEDSAPCLTARGRFASLKSSALGLWVKGRG